jgi:hypothetical protein
LLFDKLTGPSGIQSFGKSLSNVLLGCSYSSPGFNPVDYEGPSPPIPLFAYIFTTVKLHPPGPFSRSTASLLSALSNAMRPLIPFSTSQTSTEIPSTRKKINALLNMEPGKPFADALMFLTASAAEI